MKEVEVRRENLRGSLELMHIRVEEAQYVNGGVMILTKEILLTNWQMKGLLSIKGFCYTLIEDGRLLINFDIDA